jgi:type I restriction enzyme S subunit
VPGFHREWEVKRLGDVAEIVMGQSPSSSNYNASGAGLPLIQGNADIKNRKTITRMFTTQITKRGKSGDILMSVRAPVGEISRAGFDVCLGRGVWIRSLLYLIGEAAFVFMAYYAKTDIPDRQG